MDNNIVTSFKDHTVDYIKFLILVLNIVKEMKHGKEKAYFLFHTIKVTTDWIFAMQEHNLKSPESHSWEDILTLQCSS